MAENYVSTNMETGIQVREALTKIESYQPDLFAWTEIGDSVTVNLKSPTTYSGITDPGDYVIYKFSNGPSKIPSTLSPILLSLRDGKKYVSANGTIYTLNSAGDSWVSIDEVVDDDTILYVKSDTAPTRTNNTFWFDTSNFDGTSDGYIDLKYYDTNSSSWISVFNGDNYLKKSVLDPDGKNTDIYTYITEKVAAVVGDYGEFIKHKANQLTLIHITADERTQYAKIISESELRALINDTYKPAIKQTVDDSVSTELDTTQISADSTTLDNSYKSHLANHITADNIASWKNKADVDHIHDYTTGNTKLQASQIVSGTFGADQLPDEIKERYYQITTSPATEFGNTSITDADRKAKYHNGNAFYYETTDENTGESVRKWYRIIDSTKIGTSSWADGIIDFTGKEANMDWSNITGRPTTLEEFGITTDLYTKTQVNEKFNPIITQVESMNTVLADCEGDTGYVYGNGINSLMPLSIDRIGIQYKTQELSKFDDTMTGTIPQLDCIIKTTDNKIYKTTYNLNSTYTKPDGTLYTTTDSKEPLGATMMEKIVPLTALSPDAAVEQYFNERFPDNYSTMNANPNFESSGCGIAVTADSAKKTLTVPNPVDTSKALCTVEYSKDSLKFVYPKAKMVGNVIDVGVGSTDKINCLMDTYDKIELNVVIDFGGSYSRQISSTSRNWHSICYGKDKFVAVAYSSNYFAYSTDGINWTEGTISSTSRDWYSVCYGNGKFVAIDINSNYFAYSTNGINWTEGTISSTSRNWQSVCYGNGKFVAVAINSNYFTYSTDGIHWTESTISDTSRNWYSVCYGNGKFVTVDHNNTTFAYSTDGIHWTEGVISNTSRNWESVCYGNGKFVAVAYNSNYFTYSTDGIHWTEGAISSTSRKWYSVCYGNGKFVAVAYNSNYFAYSTDGINWYEIQMSNTVNLRSVCYSPDLDKFVAVGPFGFTIIFLPNEYSEGVRSTYYVYYYWDTPSSTITCELPAATSYIPNAAVKVDTKYTNKSAFVVSDGYYQFSGWDESNFNVTGDTEIYGRWRSKVEYFSWIRKMISSTSRKWYSICYGNGKFVAVATNSNTFAYSTDGMNWTEGTISSTSRDWITVCYGNGKYVAVAHYSKYFAYSTDGITWTEGTISSISRDWTSVCYGNDKFIAVAYDSNTFAYSTDGITWTETTNGITKNPWTSVCYGNGKYVTVAYNNTTFAYSTDGIHWTEGAISNTSREWESVCYGNDKFVAIAINSNTFAYSTDGINWTETTNGITKNPWYSVCYGDDIFVAVNTDSFAYSTDGINWTEGTISSIYQSWMSICYGNGKFVTVALNSKYFAYGSYTPMPSDLVPVN